MTIRASDDPFAPIPARDDNVVPFDYFTQQRFKRSMRLRYYVDPANGPAFVAEIPRYGASRSFKRPDAALA